MEMKNPAPSVRGRVLGRDGYEAADGFSGLLRGFGTGRLPVGQSWEAGGRFSGLLRGILAPSRPVDRPAAARPGRDQFVVSGRSILLCPALTSNSSSVWTLYLGGIGSTEAVVFGLCAPPEYAAS